MADITDQTCEKVTFKSNKRKPLRKRNQSSDEEKKSDDESTIVNSKVEEMKELRKLRKRPNGVSIVGLALGKNITMEEEITVKDPFNIKSGGMVNMTSIKNGSVKQVNDAYDTGIGTQFSAETNKRDEDEEMMKYIEDQLLRRKGGGEDKGSDGEEGDGSSVHLKHPHKYYTPEEAALQAVPEHLRQSSTQRSEEMLSNQMLSGIPEVDLGIESKIRNIEATEEAKRKLLWERRNQKDGPSQFVPTNMAVNFVQHNRFTIDGTNKAKKRTQVATQVSNQIDKTKKLSNAERASDDFHFEKFKKHYRKF